jgi:hypothetical protein
MPLTSSLNRFVFSILTKTAHAYFRPHCDRSDIFNQIASPPNYLLSSAFGIIGSLYLSKSALECDDGTEAMTQVSDPIRFNVRDAGLLLMEVAQNY